MKIYRVTKVVRGQCKAEIIVYPSSFSFLGDVDLETAVLLVGDDSLKGKSLAGKIFIFYETKGSSGGALVLQTLKNIGKAPAALISVKAPDFNLTEGAILNQVPFASGLDQSALYELKNGSIAELDLNNGILKVE